MTMPVEVPRSAVPEAAGKFKVGGKGREVVSRDRERAESRGRTLDPTEEAITRSRDERIDTWQQDEGVKKAVTKAVERRLLDPTGDRISRRKGWRAAFIGLSADKDGFDKFFKNPDGSENTANTRRPPKEQAALLRTHLKDLYKLRGEAGLQEFAVLSDQEVIEECRDFAGTVGRELFAPELLKRRSNELNLQNDIAEMSLASEENVGKKVNRLGFVRKMRDLMHAKTKTRRELGRMKNRLKLDTDEWEGESGVLTEFGNQYKEKTMEAPAIHSSEQGVHDMIVETIRENWQKGNEREEKLPEGPIPLDFFVNLPENSVLKKDYLRLRGNEGLTTHVTASGDLVKARHRLLEVSHSQDMGEIASALNEVRRKEVAYHLEDKGYQLQMKYEKRESALHYREINNANLRRVQRRSRWFTFRNAIKDVVTAESDIPGVNANRLHRGWDRTTNKAVAYGDRLYTAADGVAIKVFDNVVLRTGNQIDRAWSRFRMRHKEDTVLDKNLPFNLDIRGFSMKGRHKRTPASLKGNLDILKKGVYYDLGFTQVDPRTLTVELTDRDVVAARSTPERTTPSVGGTPRPPETVVSTYPSGDRSRETTGGGTTGPSRPGTGETGGGATGGTSGSTGGEAGSVPSRETTPVSPRPTTESGEVTASTETEFAQKTFDLYMQLMDARLTGLREKRKTLHGKEQRAMDEQIARELRAKIFLQESSKGRLGPSEMSAGYRTGVKIGNNELWLPKEYEKGSPDGSTDTLSPEHITDGVRQSIKDAYMIMYPGRNDEFYNTLTAERIKHLHVMDPRGLVDEVRIALGGKASNESVTEAEGLQTQEDKERMYKEQFLNLLIGQYRDLASKMPNGTRQQIREREMAERAVKDIERRRKEGKPLDEILKFNHVAVLTTGAHVEMGIPIFDIMTTTLEGDINGLLNVGGPALWDAIIEDPTRLAALKRPPLSRTDAQIQALSEKLKFYRLINKPGSTIDFMRSLTTREFEALQISEATAVEAAGGTPNPTHKADAETRLRTYRAINANGLLNAYAEMDRQITTRQREQKAGETVTATMDFGLTPEVQARTDEERAVLKSVKADMRKQIGRLVDLQEVELRNRHAGDKADRLRHKWDLIKDNPDFIDTAEFAELEMHDYLVGELTAQLKFLREHRGTGLTPFLEQQRVLSRDSGRPFEDVTIGGIITPGVREILRTVTGGMTPEKRDTVVASIQRTTGLDAVHAESLLAALTNPRLTRAQTGTEVDTIFGSLTRQYDAQNLFGKLLEAAPGNRDLVNQVVVEHIVDSIATDVHDENTKDVLKQLFKSNEGVLHDLAGLVTGDPAYIPEARNFVIENSHNRDPDIVPGTNHIIERLNSENSLAVNEAVAVFVEGNPAESIPIVEAIFTGDQRHRDKFIEKLVDADSAAAVRSVAQLATHNPEAARIIVENFLTLGPLALQAKIDAVAAHHPDFAAAVAGTYLRTDGSLVDTLVTAANIPQARTAIRAVFTAFPELRDRATISSRHTKVAGITTEADLRKYIKEYIRDHPDHAGRFIQEMGTAMGGMAHILPDVRDYIKVDTSREVDFLTKRANTNVADGVNMLNDLLPLRATDQRKALIDATKLSAETATNLLAAVATGHMTDAKAAITEGTRDPAVRQKVLFNYFTEDGIEIETFAAKAQDQRALIEQMTIALSPEGLNQVIGLVGKDNPKKAAELFANFADRSPATMDKAKQIIRRLSSDDSALKKITEALSDAQPDIWKNIVQRIVENHPELMIRVVGNEVVSSLISDTREKIAEKESDLHLVQDLQKVSFDVDKRSKELAEEIEKIKKDLGPMADLTSSEKLLEMANTAVDARVPKANMINVSEVKRQLEKRYKDRVAKAPQVSQFANSQLEKHLEQLEQHVRADRNNPTARTELDVLAGVIQERGRDPLTVLLDVPGKNRRVEVDMPVFVAENIGGRYPNPGDRELVEMSIPFTKLDNDQRDAMLAYVSRLIEQRMEEDSRRFRFDDTLTKGNVIEEAREQGRQIKQGIRRVGEKLKGEATRREFKREAVAMSKKERERAARDEAFALLQRTRFISPGKAYETYEREQRIKEQQQKTRKES